MHKLSLSILFYETRLDLYNLNKLFAPYLSNCIEFIVTPIKRLTSTEPQLYARPEDHLYN